MKKIKHDYELEKMAKEVMKLPYNKNGVDKTCVSKAIFLFKEHFSKVENYVPNKSL